jgi:hypothetical protein
LLEGEIMVEVKRSKKMSIRAGLEDKIIRMPAILREKLAVKLGEFVVINKIALQVDNVYELDRLTGATSAFVTNKVLKQIGVAIDTLTVTKHITMGCDPEMFLVDSTTKQLYNPGFLFPKNGPIGFDGMLAEIRPRPGVSPAEVTRNIYDMLVQIREAIAAKGLHSVRMVAKSSGWNLFAGFHVHLGIPGNLLNPTQMGYGIILRTIIKVLDYYVGTLAVIAEGNDCGRRCSPYVAYGKVSDFRVSTNIRTLEYRVPGGALLCHPVLTQGLLSLCSMVAHDVIERLRIYTEDFSNDISLEEDKLLTHMYPNALCSHDMYSTICSPSTEKAEVEAIKIKQDLEYMINHECYQEDIDNFINLSQTPLSEDVWTNWSSY